MGGIEALIKKFIYKLGIQLRNKKIFACYKFLKRPFIIPCQGVIIKNNL
jgi:hypothetical protein